MTYAEQAKKQRDPYQYIKNPKLRDLNATSLASDVTDAIQQKTEKHVTIEARKGDKGTGWFVYIITYEPDYKSAVLFGYDPEHPRANVFVHEPVSLSDVCMFLTGMLYQQVEVFNKHA